MPYVLVRHFQSLSNTEAFGTRSRYGNFAIHQTYIEFQGEYDKFLSEQIEKRQLSWNPVQPSHGQNPPRSGNAYSTDDPPYVVLNQLEIRGYKVVGTHTVKDACMWTLTK